MVTITTLTGEEAHGAIADLARLRVAVFREWPYLYDGDSQAEAEYLRHFAEAPGAALAVARDGGETVGAATAAPLSAQDETIQAPYREAGFELSRVCYFGESVLSPSYRGRGVGHAFFDAREAHARALGASTASFCAVVRSADDPRRPTFARDLAPFWTGRGYRALAGAFCRLAWRELGDAADSEKRLQVWTKALGGP